MDGLMLQVNQTHLSAEATKTRSPRYVCLPNFRQVLSTGQTEIIFES